MTDARNISRGPAQQAAVARRPRGRPSIAPARRTEIVEAFIACVRNEGIGGATVERVAGSLGISRTLIFHYFGDMQTLTRAAVEHIVAASVRYIADSGRGLTGKARQGAFLDHLVAGPNYQQLRDVVVEAEITSLAGRDQGIASIFAENWESWIKANVDEVKACFPGADPEACESVGYALTCLAQKHWELSFLGPGTKRGAAARRAAESLLATLRGNDAPASTATRAATGSGRPANASSSRVKTLK